jgi:hypothetical protein
VTLRLACALVVAAQLVLIALYLAPSGQRAILFTFVGNPLLAAGVLLALIWLIQTSRRKRNADPDRDRDGAAVGGAR